MDPIDLEREKKRGLLYSIHCRCQHIVDRLKHQGDTEVSHPTLESISNDDVDKADAAELTKLSNLASQLFRGFNETMICWKEKI